MNEAAGSSKGFSMAQWQKHLQDNVQEMGKAYNDEVALKREAQNQYDSITNPKIPS